MLFNRKPRSPARLSVEALDNRIVPAPLTLSVGDATVIEGNEGTTTAAVVVRLDAPSNKTVTVNYSTANGTATAGSDYGAVSGTLSFARGETVKTVLVPIYGDRIGEPDESFAVVLGGAKGAAIRDGTGVVTIIDNEPRLSVGDARGTVVYRADGSVSGATLHFTVSLVVAYDQAVTVSYATADGPPRESSNQPDGAVAGVHYLATSGTLTFAPGETTKTVAVEVIGGVIGLDMGFSINLSGASSNARIIDGRGVGTIRAWVEQPSSDGCEWSPYGC